MKIIAHRGASGYAPENTIGAIEKAVAQDADFIEFDVHLLPSGEVVLMHDHRVNRTTDGAGYVLQHSFAHLRSLNVGENEVVPTLEEALDLIDRRVRVNIELKGPGSAPGVAGIIKKYLRQGWQHSDFIVSSFDHHDLKKFHGLMPDIEIAALQDSIPIGYAAFAEELGAVAVCPSDEFINRAYVDDAHARGLKVYVWTVNAAEEVSRMYDLGVDGIFTDFPDASRAVVQSLKIPSSILEA